MKNIIVLIFLFILFCTACERDNFNLGNRLFKEGNYEDAIKKYSEALIKSPDNFKIYFNRSLAWKSLNEMNNALKDLDKVIELKPELPFPYLERGIIRGEQGLEDLELKNYNKAIELKSDYIQAYHNRGFLKEENGDYNSAFQDYSRALEIDPDYFPSLVNRASIYQKQKKFKLSIIDLNRAINLQKDSYDAYLSRGKAYYKLKKYDVAIEDFDMVVRLNPEIEEAYLYRGNIWYLKCNIEKVIKNYSMAISLLPNDQNEYNELAWIFATVKDEKYRDGKKAVKYALKASELGYNYKNLDTLSAAYAEYGRFEDAIKIQNKAINLCVAEKDCGERLPQLLNRLEYYKKKEPWREECLKDRGSGLEK